MRKYLSSILAVLLTLSLAFGIAACGGKEIEAPAEPTETVDLTVDAPVTGEPAKTDHEPTTVDESAGEGETTEPAAKTPDQMSKEELVEYYNGAIDFVREKKPAISAVETKKIESLTTDKGSFVDTLLSPIVNILMPGKPKNMTIAKGHANDHYWKDGTNKAERDVIRAGNYFFFMMSLPKSVMRLSDLTDIKATKSGENYIISVTLAKETNPENDGTSRHSRVMGVLGRQMCRDELGDQGVSFDVQDVTMVYSQGKSSITVNPKGEIVSANSSVVVDVVAKDAKIAMFTFVANVHQTTSYTYSVAW